ncbi:MAG: ferrous iron transport protein A [Acidobacteria bacterium]|nr:ferrous iron transport protein A [Acidobacteriota bacterium]
MQLSGKKDRSRRTTRCACAATCLSELREGEQGVLECIDLSPEEARRMMELGFLPGTCIVAARCAPGGDPRVYQVDGSEIAMRRETAARLRLRNHAPADCML